MIARPFTETLRRQRAVKHTERQPSSAHRLLCGRPRLCLDCLRAANLNNEHNENAIEYNRPSTATSTGEGRHWGPKRRSGAMHASGYCLRVAPSQPANEGASSVCSFPCLTLKLYTKNAAVKRAHVERLAITKSRSLCVHFRVLFRLQLHYGGVSGVICLLAFVLSPTRPLASSGQAKLAYFRA